MKPNSNQFTVEDNVMFHPSGDMIVTLILDPAVAAQIRDIASRWSLDRLSDAAADLLLTGLITVNSTARAQ